MPPEAHLPFLVVHGAIVWKVLLYALVLLSYLPFARRSFALSAHLGIVAIALGFWAIILHAIGSDSLDKMSRSDLENGSEITSASIASSMPGSRAKALQRLEDWYWRPRDPKQVADAFALSRLTGTCPATLFEEAQRYEEALFYFKQCGTREDVARILFLIGRYEEAAAWSGSQMADDVAVTSGSWTFLAARLEQRATRRLSAQKATDARCLAALFRSWDGDAQAFDVLPAAVKNDVACTVYRVLTLPLAEQEPAFQRLSDDVRTDDRWIDLRLLFGRYEFMSSDTRVAAWSDGAELLWNYASRNRSPNVHLARSAIARYRGDFVTARDELTKVSPPVRDLDVRTEAGRIDAVQGLGFSEEHSEESWDFVAVDKGACNAQLAIARDKARAGDGLPFAALFERCNPAWSSSDVPYLMQLLPTVKEGRAALAQELRFFRGEPYVSGHIPVATHAAYRDLAHLVGDTDEERRWQGVVDREAAMLDDWHKSMALMLLW